MHVRLPWLAARQQAYVRWMLNSLGFDRRQPGEDMPGVLRQPWSLSLGLGLCAGLALAGWGIALWWLLAHMHQAKRHPS
jgi:hypothetical protein